MSFGGNVSLKELYLNYIETNYSISTYKQYIMILKKCKNLESELKKDLYDFNSEEMITLLKSFNSKTYNAISSRYSLIKKYINYAKNKGFGNLNISVDKLLTSKNIHEAIFSVGLENRYCTRLELEKAINLLINPIDKAIFMLLFEGIMGKEYSDLLTLKIEQIKQFLEEHNENIEVGDMNRVLKQIRGKIKEKNQECVY